MPKIRETKITVLGASAEFQKRLFSLLCPELEEKLKDMKFHPSGGITFTLDKIDFIMPSSDRMYFTFRLNGESVHTNEPLIIIEKTVYA